MTPQQKLQYLRDLSGDLYASFGECEERTRQIDFRQIHALRYQILACIRSHGSDALFRYLIRRLIACKGPYRPSVGPNYTRIPGVHKNIPKGPLRPLWAMDCRLVDTPLL